MSYPLAESPDPPAPGQAPGSGRSGPAWADRADLPEAPHTGRHSAEATGSCGDMDGPSSSARAGSQQQDSSSAEQGSRPGVRLPAPDRDQAASSSVEGGSPSGLRKPSHSEAAKKGRGPVLRSGISIEGVEWHSRIEKDWYAATVFVDLLTFIYVALFYQVMSKI